MLNLERLMSRPGGRRPPEPATVCSAVTITPGVRQIVLAGAGVRRILADGHPEPGAWCKLFPSPENGRAYTIRAFDAAAETVTIDIVLHGDPDAGSTAAWARAARPGDAIGIGGLRGGNFALLPDSQWIWIAADPAGLPAAQRILATLPAHMTAFVTVCVQDSGERQTLETSAQLHDHWLFAPRDEVALGPDVLAHMRAHPGQAWIAGESGWVKCTHAMLLDARAVDAERITAKGYWKIGESGHRDHRFGRGHRH